MLEKSAIHNRNDIILPFLKWAGGKRWLVSNHPELFPNEYNNYLEPFLGSGAVYFFMRPSNAILGDFNSDLINTYNQIKLNWPEVNSILHNYHELHSKDFYYKIRETSFDDLQEKAAKFIYLNRTCWNGLYRVNLKGKFNVPIGTKNKVILDTDNFEQVSKSLNGAQLLATDFKNVIDQAQKGDFLFIDPPYTVKHNFNGFVKYNDQLFSWSDQIRLRDSVENAVSKGVKVLVTNADHESIHELYKGIGQKISLDRLSVISGKAQARGKFSELIIKCYK